MLREKDALDYHTAGRPGKLEVVSSKSCTSQRDLSLAYTPGVAVPCRRIAENPEDVFAYTGKGNLVAVISNGTAVLGLGDIGPAARQAGDGGQGATVQAVRRHRCLRSRDRLPRSGGDHQLRQAPRADVWRHQPRGHQGARVLPDRGGPVPRYGHPGLPRRPARHRHHLGCRRCSTPWRSSASRSTRCGWSSTAPGRPASPAPSTTSPWACDRRTWCCATAVAWCTPSGRISTRTSRRSRPIRRPAAWPMPWWVRMSSSACRSPAPSRPRC